MKKSKQPRILMVEDNRSNHQLFTDAFETKGFTVMICSSADDRFVSEVKLFQPDIISMDLMFGQTKEYESQDGFQAMAHLKNDPDTKEIPIIVLTNFFEKNKVEEAQRLGAVDYINLQGHAMSTLPDIFLRYLEDSKHYLPTHPLFRK